LLLAGAILYRYADHSANRTHSHSDDQNFSWTFRDSNDRPKQ
jgi:hypothetical protein